MWATLSMWSNCRTWWLFRCAFCCCWSDKICRYFGVVQLIKFDKMIKMINSRHALTKPKYRNECRKCDRKASNRRARLNLNTAIVLDENNKNQSTSAWFMPSSSYCRCDSHRTTHTSTLHFESRALARLYITKQFPFGHTLSAIPFPTYIWFEKRWMKKNIERNKRNAKF